MVKNLPAMWETWVWSLGWEDSLEEGMATYSSILAWRSPMDRGAWATVHGSQRVGHDWGTKHSTAQKWLKSKQKAFWCWSSGDTGKWGHWLQPWACPSCCRFFQGSAEVAPTCHRAVKHWNTWCWRGRDHQPLTGLGTQVSAGEGSKPHLPTPPWVCFLLQNNFQKERKHGPGFPGTAWR